MNPGGIFQVEDGSGIGFVASGEISDSVFLAVMERQYILKQEVRQERAHQKPISDTEMTPS